jgi:hypothetical protein
MSGIAGLYGRSIFCFLRSLHTISIVVILTYIYTSSIWGFLFLHPCQHLMVAILTGVRWNLSVVLICISFMAMDDEWWASFFMCFLGIWTSSFEKVLFSSVAYLFIGHWFWWSLVFWAPFIFYLSVPCLIYSLANFFSHSVGGLFNLETISFVVQKVFNFI